MDRFKYTTIGHRNYKLCSPLSDARLQELVQVLELPKGPRILDLCAGKAELSMQLLATYGGEALAIDMNPTFIEEATAQRDARGFGDALSLKTLDVSQFDLTEGDERFDLVICTGARPYGDRIENLRKLRSFVRPGGQLLIAEGYWRSEPDPAYVDYLSKDNAETGIGFYDHIEMSKNEGLISLYATASTIEEFDHYDGLFGANIERYIAKNPDDPDCPALAERIRPWRDAYLRWGRETMAFGWYLYLCP